ncbi:MAG: transketolase, partial [Ignavibacteriales bacterium]|nr:transketolase [Ignavibacteriales bacterium]
DIDRLSVDTIRMLSIEGVEKAGSGHPGMPMGCAPLAHMLYGKIMDHNPANPSWANRDRFILSAGHGSMLLYSALHVAGFDVTTDDLKSFRHWGSRTPGHPEYRELPGVETTTGPLGQGFANAVGMALAQEHLAARFNREGFPILDHYIYGICSDGDLMEGVSHEAASLAGHLKLGKIVFFYDDNDITIDGPTSLAYSDDVPKRFDAYGWQVLRVSDVNDLAQIEKAVEDAKADPRPTLVVTKTVIGFGAPNKANTSGVHGSPLGDEELAATKKAFGWEHDPFVVPDEAKEFYAKRAEEGAKKNAEWDDMFKRYAEQYPKEADRFVRHRNGHFGDAWTDALPVFEKAGEKIATRKAFGKAINAVSANLDALVGGSADLAPSNNTKIDGETAFSAENRIGRNLHFGVREHGMGAVLNGMALYGGLSVYGGTFLIFSDYMRPTIRLAALMKLPVVYVFTHDSIGLGEDGPTHQPIEQIASLRAIPNLVTLRPADANETSQALKIALERREGPTALILTRQGLPTIDRSRYASEKNVGKGAYVLKPAEDTPDVMLLASGSEVAVALEAAELLEEEGKKVAVVNVASFELFRAQPMSYQEETLPKGRPPKVAVEAASGFGWTELVGRCGEFVAMNRFGASAPGGTAMKEFGFTAENVADAARKVIAKFRYDAEK